MYAVAVKSVSHRHGRSLTPVKHRKKKGRGGSLEQIPVRVFRVVESSLEGKRFNTLMKKYKKKMCFGRGNTKNAEFTFNPMCMYVCVCVCKDPE